MFAHLFAAAIDFRNKNFLTENYEKHIRFSVILWKISFISLYILHYVDFLEKKSNFDIIPKPSHKENFSFLISPFFTIVFIYLIGKGNPSVRNSKVWEKTGNISRLFNKFPYSPKIKGVNYRDDYLVNQGGDYFISWS